MVYIGNTRIPYGVPNVNDVYFILSQNNNIYTSIWKNSKNDLEIWQSRNGFKTLKEAKIAKTDRKLYNMNTLADSEMDISTLFYKITNKDIETLENLEQDGFEYKITILNNELYILYNTSHKKIKLVRF